MTDMLATSGLLLETALMSSSCSKITVGSTRALVISKTD
jgi:hypothetical protein